jgi:hypothetical protein
MQFRGGILICMMACSADSFTPQAKLADVSLIVSDPMGRPFKSVRVVRFSAEGGPNFAREFRNLGAKLVPYGSYLVELEADDIKIADYVDVNNPEVCATISGDGVIVESTIDLLLNVHVEQVPPAAMGTIWLKLVPLYGSGATRTALLDAKHNARFFNVDVGTYSAILVSHNGILGVSTLQIRDRNTTMSMRAGELPKLIGRPE